jgi:hypothetical protein
MAGPDRDKSDCDAISGIVKVGQGENFRYGTMVPRNPDWQCPLTARAMPSVARLDSRGRLSQRGIGYASMVDAMRL